MALVGGVEAARDVLLVEMPDEERLRPAPATAAAAAAASSSVRLL